MILGSERRPAHLKNQIARGVAAVSAATFLAVGCQSQHPENSDTTFQSSTVNAESQVCPGLSEEERGRMFFYRGGVVINRTADLDMGINRLILEKLLSHPDLSADLPSGQFVATHVMPDTDMVRPKAENGLAGLTAFYYRSCFGQRDPLRVSHSLTISVEDLLRKIRAEHRSDLRNKGLYNAALGSEMAKIIIAFSVRRDQLNRQQARVVEKYPYIAISAITDDLYQKAGIPIPRP